MAGTLDIHPIEQALLQRTAALIAARRAAPRNMAARPHALPRRILLVGFCGAGNTGADIRMGEIIRQMLHLFGPHQVQLAYAAARPLAQSPYAAIAWAPQTDDLATCLDQYDGLLVCEGSLFKSQFSNAMAVSFIGLLGMAAAQGKPGIAYGVEAGRMDPEIAEFARLACQDTLIIARSAVSYRLLTGELGLPARPGTDTAWTFHAAAPKRARELLVRAGWDGAAPIVCMAPVNPFWWPARPDLDKAAAMQATGAHQAAHRTSIFFHQDSDATRQAYRQYLDAIAEAVNAFCRERGAWPVLVAMEAQDRRHCLDLQARLHAPAVAILRAARIVVSSRYHALVTSMPGGVPGIGITCDERIANLMADRGAPECVLDAGAPGLAQDLSALLHHVDARHAVYAASLAPFVATQLDCLGGMGKLLAETLGACFPELAATPRASHDYLPP
jgi:polysaccharide pyruvyl transferase WcaK-like protein